MTDSATSDTAISWILARIVAPLGTSMWALTQLAPPAPNDIVAASLLFIAAASLFVAFHYGIDYADARLNSESRGAMGYE